MTIMKKIITVLTLLCALSACNSSDEEDKDMTLPVISDEVEDACPTDCQVFSRGDEIEVCFLFTDNVELGSYNIEIHHNFDHHTHSTSSVECDMDEAKDAVNAWVYNEDFAIPSGSVEYEAHQFIQIPTDIDTGDYHFMVRLTDQAGWQQLKAVAIKIQ